MQDEKAAKIIEAVKNMTDREAGGLEGFPRPSQDLI